jgi:isoleucyl-tRNA synthetase
MTDYKATLNLPKTAFPMKAGLPQKEPEQLKRWQAMDLYGQLRQLGQSRPKFIYHDGPPYANGQLHVGHALNKILKDMVCKAKTLSGFDANFVPGWDCHGLPIEHKVEKKVGKVGVKIDAKAFRAACREYASTQVAAQAADFSRMGIIADWQNPYLTMDFRYEADTIRALADIVERGHLQRGEKPVHWCPACASALAEAEVEYKDKVSPAIDVAFAVIDKASVAQAFDVADNLSDVVVPIWTTTPWTLPANQAVAVNADIAYALVQTAKTALIVAKDLVASVMARYGIDDYQVLASQKGQQLEHIILQHPLLDRQVPIILGEHVTTEAGTGNVHTAPAHGQDDFVVGQQYGLPVENPVNADSCFIASTPLVAGEHVYKANEPIIEALTQSGVLLALAKLEHSYPHCWRHKTPLIFRSTAQWFIGMDKAGLRSAALKEIDQVEWLPAWGHKRIHNMVASRPDWCISRQRAWGTPLALFVHKESGELHPRTVELMRQVAERVEQSGIQAWFDLDAAELLGDAAADYVKTQDILDVWFDSGVTHYGVLRRRADLGQPADLYLEGSDQHRGWFQSSLLTGVAINGYAPYKAVLTHGYLVDGDGRKMSKSIGNIVAAKDVMNKLGADVMRLWVASTDYQQDVRYSEEIMKRASDAYRRIRNTARFMLSNLEGFDPEKDAVPLADMLELDRWAVQSAADLQQKILTAFDNYQFHNIYQWLHNFCTVDMGSFYLDIIKDRQYTSHASGLPRRSGQTAMYHILEAMVRWLAPILSFTAEEIWQHMPGAREESVFLSTWYQGLNGAEVDRQKWQGYMLVRDEVNKVLEQARAAGTIGSALDAGVTLYADATWLVSLQALEDELRFVLITSEAQVLPFAQGQTAHETSLAGLKVAIEVLSHNKCARCWQRRADVGCDEAHAELCRRCVENIEASGEARAFA